MFARALAALVLSLALGASVNAEQFLGLLNGLQENPPVATPGTGTGTAIYNPHTKMLDVDVSFSGLVGPTNNAPP
jgi:hypothetical protein